MEEEAKDREAKKAAEDTEKQAAYDAQDELGKQNSDWSKSAHEIHAKAAENLKVRSLAKADKRAVFKTVRYSMMSHEELLALHRLSDKPGSALQEAKDFILEGLSVRLNDFENAIQEDT